MVEQRCYTYLNIRLRYIDEFNTILSVSQVTRFFEVESEIQKKLMQRPVCALINKNKKSES